MENVSKIKPSKKMINYINETIGKIYLEAKDHDYIIYISGPMTGIDNYKEKFAKIEKDIKYVYHEADIYIINPVNILDNIPEDSSYIDTMFLTEALVSISSIIIVDDSDNNYINSRGVLAELAYARGKNKDIYGMDWLYNAFRFRKFLDNGIE